MNDDALSKLLNKQSNWLMVLVTHSTAWLGNQVLGTDNAKANINNPPSDGSVELLVKLNTDSFNGTSACLNFVSWYYSCHQTNPI